MDCLFNSIISPLYRNLDNTDNINAVTSRNAFVQSWWPSKNANYYHGVQQKCVLTEHFYLFILFWEEPVSSPHHQNVCPNDAITEDKNKKKIVKRKPMTSIEYPSESISQLLDTFSQDYKFCSAAKCRKIIGKIVNLVHNSRSINKSSFCETGSRTVVRLFVLLYAKSPPLQQSICIDRWPTPSRNNRRRSIYSIYPWMRIHGEWTRFCSSLISMFIVSIICIT